MDEAQDKAYVDPASLRITFEPYDAPKAMRSGWSRLSPGGSGASYMDTPLYYQGQLTVTWDSPEGPFQQVVPLTAQLGPEDIERLRPRCAENIAAAYEEMRATAQPRSNLYNAVRKEDR